MYITYHRDIQNPDESRETIPYAILSDEIKAFIVKYKLKQEKYYFAQNAFYFFLYLDNGDRIDCQL